MNASIFDNEPTDPFQSSSNHKAGIAQAIDWFEQANQEPLRAAWFLSNGLECLEHAALRRDRLVLAAADRFAVLAAIERAYRAAWKALPAEYPRSKIVTGMRAAAALVDFWHKPRKTDDALHDTKAMARCFRNDMHNFCLLAEIQERAVTRELFGGEPTTVFDDLPALAFIAAA